MAGLGSRRGLLFGAGIAGLFGGAAQARGAARPPGAEADLAAEVKRLSLEVKKLSAERDIREQLYRYQEAINRADRAALERFFGDATIRTVAASNPDNVHPPIHGGEQFAEGFFESVYLYEGVPHTQYSATNPIIQFNAAVDAATCHAYYFILQGFGKYNYDTAEPPKDFSLQVCGAGRYLDTWRLVESEWKLADREIYSDMNGDYHKHMKLRPRRISKTGASPQEKAAPPPQQVDTMAISALRAPA
jgi:hypothetical protein